MTGCRRDVDFCMRSVNVVAVWIREENIMTEAEQELRRAVCHVLLTVAQYTEENFELDYVLRLQMTR